MKLSQQDVEHIIADVVNTDFPPKLLPINLASLSALHIDWYHNAKGQWVCAIIDDASRMLLGIRECEARSSDLKFWRHQEKHCIENSRTLS